jgi:hypothetical protein
LTSAFRPSLFPRAPPADTTAAWLLLRASWQVDDQPDLKARYQIEFVEAAGKVPDQPRELAWIALQGRRANGLRELGHFEEATAVLRSIPRAELDVPLPAEPSANEEPTETQLKMREEAENRRSWNRYIEILDVLIARRDRSAEPLDAIPPQVAAGICIQTEKAGRPAPEACGEEEVQSMIAEYRSHDQN